MNLYNVKNIKDLPQLEQILPGNFIVVENFTGTNKLDFDDFVIGPRNTSFANQVFNDILSLSSYSISLSATTNKAISSLSAEYLQNFSNTSNNLSSLSSAIFGGDSVGESNTVQGLVKMFKNTVIIPSNALVFTFEFSLPTNIFLPLQNSDISIVPSTFQPTTLEYRWGIINRTVDNGNNTTTYTVQITTNSVNSTLDRIYDVTVLTV